MSIEAMKLAASVLRGAQEYKRGHTTFVEAVEEIEEAIGQAEQAQPVAWERIQEIAAARYKVGPSHDSMFYRFAVRAGDGEHQLYLGREVECANMAAKFTGTFLDGAFLAFEMLNTAPPPRQPWVGLTLNEIQEMKDEGIFLANCEAITEVIEAKLMEKNK